jgi:hypothetical protein
MSERAARLLFGLSSLLLALGGAAHAAAFPRALRALVESGLPPFLANGMKALWLADSTTSLIVAAIFAAAAARPTPSARVLLMLAALVPAATGILIYLFVGGFYAAPLMVGIGIAAFTAAIMLPARSDDGRRAARGD